MTARMLFGASILFVVLPVASRAAGVPSVDSRDLAELIESRPNLLLLDLREPADYDSGHLPFAVNVPWHDDESARKRLARLVEGPPRPIVLYGRSALALIDAARFVATRNGGPVLVYPGGVDGWTKYESGYLEIEWAGLWHLLTRKHPLVLDFRAAEAWAAGHIPGALRADDEAPDATWKAWASSGRPIITYCTGAACGASRKAAKRLAAAGARPVYQFPGGYEEWAERTAGVAR